MRRLQDADEEDLHSIVAAAAMKKPHAKTFLKAAKMLHFNEMTQDV